MTVWQEFLEMRRDIKEALASTDRRVVVDVKSWAIRVLTIAEIIPLKACPRAWCWLLTKAGRI